MVDSGVASAGVGFALDTVVVSGLLHSYQEIEAIPSPKDDMHSRFLHQISLSLLSFSQLRPLTHIAVSLKSRLMSLIIHHSLHFSIGNVSLTNLSHHFQMIDQDLSYQ